MKNADVEFIQRVLDGDDTAFTELVKKYQKSVHALAWRKVQDFHIAEDITQETFLKAYRRLSTLKEPQSFASWLYVIATNQCNTWLGKKRLRTQSLDDTNSIELEKDTYSSYVSAEKERTSIDAQREVVKKLLAKLQESDRTVITLYYLGGMTYEDISRFLGVSVSAIKNRLYRARQFLQKEETMIREALDHFQISPNLTDNIMQEISRLKPTSASSAPLVPWTIAAASTVVLFMLILGIGSQYLARFQQPYSFDAQSEMTVELVDTPIVLNVDAKSDVQNRLGNPNIVGKSDNSGQKPDEVLLAAAQTEGEDELSVPKQQWIPLKDVPSAGGTVWSISATPEGEVYICLEDTIGKLTTDGKAWQLFPSIKLDGFSSTSSIAKWNNTLYFTPGDKLLVSMDEGKSWKTVNSPIRSGGGDYKFVITEKAIFLLDETSGIYQSNDAGKSWNEISPETPDNWFRPRHLVSIRNILVVSNSGGLHPGLYRFINNKWELLQLPVTVGVSSIRSIAATENYLYVMVVKKSGSADKNVKKQIKQKQERSWWIFRSTDIGESWKDITPTDAWSLLGTPPLLTLVAAKETVLAIGKQDVSVARSTDTGNTWTYQRKSGISLTSSREFTSVRNAVALNDNTFYVGGTSGIHRSIDGGKTWHRFNAGLSRWVNKLYAFRGKHKRVNHTPPLLYSIVENNLKAGDLVFSKDGGKSWKIVEVLSQIEESNSEHTNKKTVLPRIQSLQASDGVLYAKGETYGKSYETRIYHISENGDTLIPIEGMPVFNSQLLYDELRKLHSGYVDSSIKWPPNKAIIEKFQNTFVGSSEFIKAVAMSPGSDLLKRGMQGAFAISGDTFFMEYNYKLFRWKLGENEWYDTGVEVNFDLTTRKKNIDLEIAISGDTVYVGTQNGNLLQSIDCGDTWMDITPEIISNLKIPYRKLIRDIIFNGSKVYVATPEGVITSDDGKNWRVLNNEDEEPVSMSYLATNNATLYGLSMNNNIYRLEHDSESWKQVASQDKAQIYSLAVDRDTFYVGTSRNGVMHFTLEE